MKLVFHDQYVEVEQDLYNSNIKYVTIFFEGNIKAIVETTEDIKTDLIIKGVIEIIKVENNILKGNLVEFSYVSTTFDCSEGIEAVNPKVILLTDNTMIIDFDGFRPASYNYVNVKPLDRIIKNVYEVTQ